MNYWDSQEYKSRLKNEWFAVGMVDPGAYSSEKEWIKVLEHEKLVKDCIYQIREQDASKNKYLCLRTGIDKYKPQYRPIQWDIAQAQAFEQHGRPEVNYIYDPLKNSDDYYFDFRIADVWCNWIERHMCHIEGDLGNQLVLLSLEQRNFFRNVYGWRNKETGLRRYREIFKYIPRKNSKTFDLACMGLGTLALDKEYGCKVIAVATNEEQSRKALAPAQAIINKDKNSQIAGGALARYFKSYVKSITAKEDTDTFTILPFKEKSAHGGNFHLSILDEVHVMPDDSMYNVAISSTGARSQPIIAMITTAGTTEESFCNNKFSYAKSICSGLINDNEFLPILYFCDEKLYKDDWKNKHVWMRVNPMYGLGKKADYFDRMFKKSINDPTFENTFKQLDLNLQVSSESAAFNMVNWRNCKSDYLSKDIVSKQDIMDLRDKSCYAGLDLASKNDLCSLTLDFPYDNKILSWSWLPAKGRKKIKDPERFDKSLIVCGESIIDFKELREDIFDICSNFNVKNLGFDPRFATELIQGLNEMFGDDEFCIELAQSAAAVNEATRSCINDVYAEIITHNGCPLLNWQLNNSLVRENSSGHLMLKKSNLASAKKIDAAAAWVNARVLTLFNEDEDSLTEEHKNGGYF
ncbi:MAG: terminase TerL endonuclease subunit [Desulfobulbia bacterium]